MIIKSEGISLALIGEQASLLKKVALDVVEHDLEWNARRSVEDLMIVEPADGNIGINEIKKLESFFMHRPLGGQRKYAIIHDAERFTTEAANAFLKLLEEPPYYAVILLTSISWNSIISTIRSRCFAFDVKTPEEPLKQLKAKYREKVKYIYAVCYSDFKVLEFCLDKDIENIINELIRYESLEFTELLKELIEIEKDDLTLEKRLKLHKIHVELIRRFVKGSKSKFFSMFVALKDALTAGNTFSNIREFAKTVRSIVQDIPIISHTSYWNRIVNLDLLEWLIELVDSGFSVEEEDYLWLNSLIRRKVSSLNKDLVIYRIVSVLAKSAWRDKHA